ncbi:hypothetical protein MASR1M32_21950 [Rhodobacter sp.]
MKRIRKLDDGTEVVYETPDEGPFRVEIEVATLDDLRQLNREGKLRAIRMTGKPPGKVSQYTLCPPDEVVDFDWKA